MMARGLLMPSPNADLMTLPAGLAALAFTMTGADIDRRP